MAKEKKNPALEIFDQINPLAGFGQDFINRGLLNPLSESASEFVKDFEAVVLEEIKPKRRALNYKYFTAEELSELEATYPDGLTTDQIVDFCVASGMRFSKPTLKSYVAKGLVDRSIRRKKQLSRKRYASQGVYDTTVIRRIANIKHLLEDDEYTLEEVVNLFISDHSEIEISVSQAYRALIEKRNSFVRRIQRGQTDLDHYVSRYDNMIRVVGAMLMVLDVMGELEAEQTF